VSSVAVYSGDFMSTILFYFITPNGTWTDQLSFTSDSFFTDFMGNIGREKLFEGKCGGCRVKIREHEKEKS